MAFQTLILWAETHEKFNSRKKCFHTIVRETNTKEISREWRKFITIR